MTDRPMGPQALALRSRVSLTAFRYAWDGHLADPKHFPETLAADLADTADRSHDLMEMHHA